MTDYPDLQALTLERNTMIAADYAAGKNIQEIAEAAGISVAKVRIIANAFGITRRRKIRCDSGLAGGNNEEKRLRNEEMCAAYLSGRSLEDVSKDYNITRERVRQILVKNGHEDRHNGFNMPARVASREAKLTKAAEKEAKKAERIARQQRVRDMYASGMTYKEICEETGHCLALVQNDVWATGGPNRNAMAGKARRKLSVEDRENILSLYARNVSLPAIAKEFEISPEYVRNLVYMHGGHRTRREGALS